MKLPIYIHGQRVLVKFLNSKSSIIHGCYTSVHHTRSKNCSAIFTLFFSSFFFAESVYSRGEALKKYVGI